MIEVVEVRFRKAGKAYTFAVGKQHVKQGDSVIVETARGVEMGTVINNPRELQDMSMKDSLKTIMRVATESDCKKVERNKEKEKEAFKICQEKIAARGLKMKLIAAEYTFDNNKVLFYFTADGRVDFRELVKDLAAVFRTRIELRQIGVRDETKMRGGLGLCGRELCCCTYLSDFIPVSIKMAKEQNLSLNPGKISGLCGRLMCCLKNEEEVYEELNSHLPNVGDRVMTPEGLKGEVKSLSILRQQVKVIVDLENKEKEVRDYKVGELKFKPKRRGKGQEVDIPKEELTKEELKELKKLEKLHED